MGISLSMLSQTFPPRPRFSVDDIPDLSGQVAIVTGGNGGIGKEIAKALLNHNAKVYIAGRSHQKVAAAIRQLKEQTGRDAHFLQLDLADLTSVKAAAEAFMRQVKLTWISYQGSYDISRSERELHILFNNAGVMVAPPDLLTAQFYDLQFGTNVLGHFHFATLLLPALLVGVKTSPDGKVRVVNVSSTAAYLAPKAALDFDAFIDGPGRSKYSPFELYTFSKLGNALFANEMARRYGDEGIICSACNPGNLDTDLPRYFSSFMRLITKPFIYPAPYGALTPLWAGTSKEGLEMNGKFLIPWARYTSTPPQGSLNEELAADMWMWCARQCAKLP